jgi:hypothetical protein
LLTSFVSAGQHPFIFFLIIGLVCVVKLFVGKVKFIVGGIIIALVRDVSVLSIIAFIVCVDLVCLVFSALLLVVGVISALGVTVVLVSKNKQNF